MQETVMLQPQEIMIGDQRGLKIISFVIPDGRPARGVRKTFFMSPHRIIPEGVLPPGSLSRFSELACKRADRFD